MEKIIKINGMKCDKCANRVKGALESIDEVSKVQVILDEGIAKIEGNDNLNVDIIKEKIDDLGYEVTGIK